MRKRKKSKLYYKIDRFLTLYGEDIGYFLAGFSLFGMLLSVYICLWIFT